MEHTIFHARAEAKTRATAKAEAEARAEAKVEVKTQVDAETEAERLVQTYSDLILRLSYTYLNTTHDAEDICQTVFLKLLTTPQTFESAAHERAWIIRATINACKDELRAFRRRSVGLDAVAEMPAPPIPNHEVLEGVMSLPQKYRETIYLHYYEGYTIREIAALLNRSQAAVTAQLERGRKKLRVILGGDNDEERA